MLSDAINVPDEFEHAGVRYKATPLDLVRLGRFSAWLVGRAQHAAMRVKDAPDELLKLNLSVVTADVAAGLYEPGGEYFLKALFTFSGQVKALQLILEPEHPGIDEDTCAEILKARYDEHLQQILARGVGDAGKASSDQAGPSATGPNASPGSPSTAKSRSKKRKGSRRSR